MADTNVLRDTVAAYTAHDVIAANFTDAVPRSDTEAANYAIASVPDEIINGALVELNRAANGETYWTDTGILARFGGAPSTGWNPQADDLAFCDGTTTAVGQSWWPTDAGTFNLAVRNSSVALRGLLRFDVAGQEWSFWTNGVKRWEVDTSKFGPASDGGLDLAEDTVRVGDAYLSGAMYVAGAPTGGWDVNGDDIVVGDGTGPSGMSFLANNNGSSRIVFGDPDDYDRAFLLWNHNGDKLSLRIGGVEKWVSDTSSWSPASAGGLTAGTPAQPFGNLPVFTSLKTANHTATAGQRVPYDASGGTFTLTAPASPSQGQRWAVKETANDATAITIAGNGSNIEDPVGATVGASFSLGLAYVSVEWEYDGTVWRVI